MRNGQWVKCKISDDKQGVALAAGGHLSREGFLVGIVASASRSTEGKFLLPRRVVLVDSQGENLVAFLNKKLANLWVCLPGEPPTDTVDCLGAATEILPVVDRLDIPEARRPSYNPLP